VSVDAAVNGDWRPKRVSSNDNYFNPRAPHDPFCAPFPAARRYERNFRPVPGQKYILRETVEFFDHEIMKLALIAIGLLATIGVVYAACVFC
jgi:hypothetical protein